MGSRPTSSFEKSLLPSKGDPVQLVEAEERAAILMRRFATHPQITDYPTRLEKWVKTDLDYNSVSSCGPEGIPVPPLPSAFPQKVWANTFSLMSDLVEAVAHIPGKVTANAPPTEEIAKDFNRERVEMLGLKKELTEAALYLDALSGKKYDAKVKAGLTASLQRIKNEMAQRTGQHLDKPKNAAKPASLKATAQTSFTF